MNTRVLVGALFSIIIVSSGVGSSILCVPGKAERIEPRRSATAQASIKNPFGQLNPSAPSETAQWGQLAVHGIVPSRGISSDGVVSTSAATWTWEYILDGHAVRDTYVSEKRSDGRPTFHGTALRIYNPAQEKWEISWIDNASSPDDASKLKLFDATYEEGKIVMRHREGNPAWRTLFFDIRADRFKWRNEPSGQSMTCVRKR